MTGERILMVFIEPTTYIVDLINELMCYSENPIDVLFCSLNQTQLWNVSLDGISCDILPIGRFAAARTLWRKLRSCDYRILHLSGWGHSHLLLALLLGFVARTPVLVETDTPHRRRIAWWKRVIKRLAYPTLFRIPRFFLPGGTRQALNLQHYGVPKSRIVIAYMTVDTTAISAHIDSMTPARRQQLRDQIGISSEDSVFLYVGRLEDYKGVGDLIQAFRLLSSSSSPPGRMLLVGDGTMQVKIEDECRTNPAIKYLGRLAGADLIDAYALADCFVLPSQSESWGLVVNEAMAAGLPVIVTDQVGCIDDLVIEGHTGCIVPAQSPPVLAAAMKKFLENPNARTKMASNVRQEIAPWTMVRWANVIRDAWEEVQR